MDSMVKNRSCSSSKSEVASDSTSMTMGTGGASINSGVSTISGSSNGDVGVSGGVPPLHPEIELGLCRWFPEIELGLCRRCQEIVIMLHLGLAIPLRLPWGPTSFIALATTFFPKPRALLSP